MDVISDVCISSNAINAFYDLKAKLILTTEEIKNLERFKRMNNLETENQKEYSIAEWIVKNYENSLNLKHLEELRLQFGISKSLLTNYFYCGKKYIKEKTPMRAGKKIQGYIDEILSSETPKEKELPIELPTSRKRAKVVSNPQKYGVQVDENTIKLFDTQEFAQYFLAGLKYAGQTTGKIVTVNVN